MVNRIFGTHFHQWWNGEKAKLNLRIGVNFVVGVNFFPRDNCPGVHCRWSKKFLHGKKYRRTVPWFFVSRYNTWQHLRHYWGVHFPGRCLGIFWYFFTYNDTDYISLYAKVCIRYGMFLYICLQCVPVVFPNISRGTRDPCVIILKLPIRYTVFLLSYLWLKLY